VIASTLPYPARRSTRAAGSVHAFSNPHDEPARYVAILTPSGYEDYFRAVAEHTAKTGGMPDPTLTAELMARHHTVLADPLPDPL
jgi:hypothetical protein